MELYLESMKECHRLASHSPFKMDFKIETSDEFGTFLLVRTNSLVGELTMQIQVSSLCFNENPENSDEAPLKKYDNSVIHIEHVYGCFEESDRLKQFRDLMCLMRIWRYF